MRPEPNPPTVSVLIPVYNEQQYLPALFSSLLRQDYPKSAMEILFIDGASEDRTAEMVRAFIRENPNARLLDNSRRIIPAALNIGIREARGEYLMRLDAHAEYADDYISQCMRTILETGADNVGGPTVAKGKNPVQQAVAAAFMSPFALGGGGHHRADYEGYADTVFLGTFRKQTLEALGGYDEHLPRAEDDDLNYRLTRSGGKIYISPKIQSVYYPRSRYTDVWRQYVGFGRAKAAGIRKHRAVASLTHLVPCLFVAFLLLGPLAALLAPVLWYPYAGVLCLYLLLDLWFSLRSGEVHGAGKARLFYVHILIHLAYGCGFWAGIFRHWILGK